MYQINGPQYASSEFQQFAHDWEFCHVTSSPKYPQSNGKAEQAVKMAKRLLKRAWKSQSDPYLSLLDFRNTPTQGMDTSPAQRLMSRRTKTLLPTKESLLAPEVHPLKSQEKQLTSLKRRQAFYYNQGARDLKPVEKGEKVRIAPPETRGQSTNEWKKGRVKNTLGNRSYEIESNGQTNRRNRQDIRPSQHAEIDPNMYEDIDRQPVQKLPVDTPSGQTAVNLTPEPLSVPKPRSDPAPPLTTRSGRVVKQPPRFKEYVN